MNTATRSGLVVAAFGRHCLVESDDGTRLICHPRGKKSAVVVGDRVDWLPSQDEGTIERVHERRNLFYRQDEIRTKSFAANLDQVLVLVAADPEFSEHQLCRALIAAEEQGLEPLIVLNKRDLGAPFERAWARLAPYREAGHAVLPLSLRPGGEDLLTALAERLRGRATLVLGPSGAGKSSLINHFVPDAGAQTGEVSRALNSGKHTTTSTTWYWLAGAHDGEHPSALIDSPGFQEFGLHHIDAARLASLMRDFQPLLGHCRFHNCSHTHEPGCAVREAVEREQAPRISAQRYRIYQDILEELSRPKY